MKKQRNLWLPNRRQFVRAGLLGGMGLSVHQMLSPAQLWAGFRPKAEPAPPPNPSGGPPNWTWMIELDGDSTGDIVMVTIDLVDSNNDYVSPQPYEPAGSPFTVGANSVYGPFGVSLNSANIGANVPGIGSAYCSGIKKDYTIYTTATIDCKGCPTPPHHGPTPARAAHAASAPPGKAPKAAAPNKSPAKLAAGPKGLAGLLFSVECQTPQKVSNEAPTQHLWTVTSQITTNLPFHARVIHQAFFAAPNGITGALPVIPKHRPMNLTGIDYDTATIDCAKAATNGGSVIFAVFVTAKTDPPQTESDRALIPNP